ncbi:MAG: bifunctional hydroxymethylpyrimidine kinase/phosphomethylpyrimidine kinase [Nitrospinaceae bacterium]|nr:MAG: bifunctional hydroxymethylpyrimidine kinase/phosphomethylpyrimidine kinase [Nitrospinaceae bacterium]
MNTVPTALTIAGSDPSGGAGIQADLKTFAAFKTFGQSVISSLTIQNTLGVQGTFDIPADTVAQQLKALLDDKKPLAVKTGMLGNEAVVECVARQIKRARIKKLVVDPVIRSSSGKTLLSKRGVQALKDNLLPLALVVTPNIKEAEILSGVRIAQPSDRLKAARAILKTGVKSVLITGGHLKGNPEDFFYDGGRPVKLVAERLTREDLHGTGCVFSAAVTAGLALGKPLALVLSEAKEFMRQAILGGVRSGEGQGSVEPLHPLYQNEERWDIFQRVSRAAEVLKEEKIGHLVPEVQSNLGMGLTGAKEHQDVIGFPGRIVKYGQDIVTLSPPQFGGSRHVANIVLTAMRYDPAKRAVMNIKYTPELMKICKRLKFKTATFNRADEPKQVRHKEGSSLEWGTDTAIRKTGFVPDIIYDIGGMGKEEMIRVISEDVESLVDKVLKIHWLSK